MLADWALWLCIYLGAGAALLLALRWVISATGVGDRRTPWVRQMMQAVQDMQGPKTVDWRSVRRQLVLVPLIWLVWPLALGIGIREAFFPSQPRYAPPDPQEAFAYRHASRSKEVTQAQAQLLGEIAPDPLGRTPDLPFGHLNPAWRALLECMHSADTLRYFEIAAAPGAVGAAGAANAVGHSPKTTPGAAQRGLAVVRGQRVRSEFIFESN